MIDTANRTLCEQRTAALVAAVKAAVTAGCTRVAWEFSKAGKYELYHLAGISAAEGVSAQLPTLMGIQVRSWDAPESRLVSTTDFMWSQPLGPGFDA
ncbi:MAG: hypothetical protein IBJ11_12630 [Phycisphaerales bacterium]|nr:hypothetical protein [Phycisphaerales bacterium]